MVAISFIILRSKEPDMARPYKVKNDKLIGTIAVIMSGLMVQCILFQIPVVFTQSEIAEIYKKA